MSLVALSESEQDFPPSRRRHPLTYPQALEFARQIVGRESRDSGSDMSADELEVAAVKQAAQLFRQSF